MGSGLVQAYVATWGALIEEKTLSGDSNTLQISNIPAAFKYLHVFITVRSDQVAGPVAFTMKASNGAATYNGTYSTQTAPNVLTVTNYVAAAAWACPDMGDNTQDVLSEWVITQDPAITIKTFFSRAFTWISQLYTGAGQVVLPVGETYINTIKLTAAGAALFKAGSKMAIYGVN
jgi:hypothetical protein